MEKIETTMSGLGFRQSPCILGVVGGHWTSLGLGYLVLQLLRLRAAYWQLFQASALNIRN